MESEPIEERDRNLSGVTLRAVVVGLSLVAGFGFLIPYLQDLKAGADLSLGPINSASILALITLLDPARRLLHPGSHHRVGTDQRPAALAMEARPAQPQRNPHGLFDGGHHRGNRRRGLHSLGQHNGHGEPLPRHT